MTDIAVHCIITGRVQGVWYRAWTEKEARALGLSGWVRNLPDGSVEALFSGPETVVREMIGRCRSGPPLANVDGVAETPAPLPEEQGFTIRDCRVLSKVQTTVQVVEGHHDPVPVGGPVLKPMIVVLKQR